MTTPVEVKKAKTARAGAPDVWRSFRTDIDDVFDRFARSFGMPQAGRFFESAVRPTAALDFAAPAVDVAEDENGYRITAEVPGVDQKDIEVSITGNVLTLKGEKHQEKEEQGKDYYLSERTYGAFQRSFTLPDGIDRDKIAAEFGKGVLTITLPKTAEAQKPQKTVEVKAA